MVYGRLTLTVKAEEREQLDEYYDELLKGDFGAEWYSYIEVVDHTWKVGDNAAIEQGGGSGT